ncbi:MAG: CPBP family intramembrane metalloprotease [Sandaracinaceae bacterium]|nr:CPBP family intramembrane metalloprotease [Sandaracinaceae bacterium]
MLSRVLRRWVLPFFYDESQARLRSLWRIGIQLALLFALTPLVGPGFRELERALAATPEHRFGEAGLWIVVSMLVITSVWACCRFLDRRSLVELGLRVTRGFWLDLAFGVVLGALLMGAIALAERALDVATYAVRPSSGADVPDQVYVVVALYAFVAVAVNEELVSRGYHLTNLAEGLSFRWVSRERAVLAAAILSSLVFGLAHATNPHASITSTGNIVLAGLMLATGYLVTGELAIPLGLHLGWNFFQNLFGMPVSGQDRFFFGALLVRVEHGPEWLTGGAFGPEAGMTGTLACVLGTLLVLGWVRIRKRELRIADVRAARFVSASRPA